MKTPKSMFFPSVVKALCNNTEIVKLISKYTQGASYDLVEEIRRWSVCQELSTSNKKPSHHSGQGNMYTGMLE